LVKMIGSSDCLLQGNPTIICNVDDSETIAQAQKVIEIPHQVDCLQGILTVVPLQLLSLHIAELRSYDVSTGTL